MQSEGDPRAISSWILALYVELQRAIRSPRNERKLDDVNGGENELRAKCLSEIGRAHV